MAASDNERQEKLTLSKSEALVAAPEHNFWAETSASIWKSAKNTVSDSDNQAAVAAGAAIIAVGTAFRWRSELGTGITQLGRNLLGTEGRDLGSLTLNNPFLSSEAQGLSKASQGLARLVTDELPQLDENGKVRYFFGGSLSMNLIAGAGGFTELNGAQVLLNNDAQTMAARFVRKMHDVDLIAGSRDAISPINLKFSELDPNLAAAFKKAPSADRLPIDVFDNGSKPSHAVKVNIGDRDIYVRHPLTMTANKLEFALSTFEYGELPKLKGDFEKLLAVSSTLKSREELLATAQATLDATTPRSLNDLRAQVLDPNYNGPLKEFVDDLVARHPENKYLQELDLSKAHSLAVLRLLGKMPSEGDKQALIQFLNSHKSDIDKFAVNEYSARNRQMAAEMIKNDHPEMVKDLNLQPDASVEQISQHLQDHTWVLNRAAKMMPGTNFDLSAKESLVLDMLNSMNPARVPQELADITQLLDKNVNQHVLASILASPRAQDPLFRQQLLDGMKAATENYGGIGLNQLMSELKNKVVLKNSTEDILQFLAH